MASGSRIDYTYQHSVQQKPSTWALTWPPMVAQTMDIYLVSDNTWASDVDMTSSGCPRHNHRLKHSLG